MIFSPTKGHIVDIQVQISIGRLATAATLQNWKKKHTHTHSLGSGDPLWAEMRVPFSELNGERPLGI
jgi:hypothetical protein